MRLSAVWHATRNTFKAIRNGELLLRLRADKFYLHIMYLFLLIWAGILLSLQVEKTLYRVNQNAKTIETLRIHRTEKEAELIRLHSASATQIRLKQLGSPVTLPDEPAKIIRKK